MSDSRTPDQIERDIERDRAKLNRTVDELQDRISPERIFRELTRGLGDHGSDIGEAITQSVKRNPVALAVTGVGLAWLMSGRSWDEDKRAVQSVTPSRESADPLFRHRRPAPLPSDRAPVATDPYGSLADHAGDGVLTDGAYGDDWIYADDDMYWVDIEIDDADSDEDASPAVRERLMQARQRAGETVSNASASLHDGVRSTRDGIATGAENARTAAQRHANAARDGATNAANSAADSLRSTRDSAAAKARRIRRRLSRGTESLTEEARERVVAARWAAVKARRATARTARDGRDRAEEFYTENPLVVGGLALAAGAILASALPRTKQEDDLIGRQSDRYYDQARDMFEIERQKAVKVADRAAATAQEVLEEERAKIDGSAPGETSAVEHAANEVKDGISRVAAASRDEAEKQKLGQPS
ncbi:DUF3618 domain-containing protein [Sagittula sp. SSi028]|uniref:DUF3618 domain-containing protein n=1 Tax=Sagittula sp. SSi028 TaxID=3400636 RepID=UPI003AF7E93E